MIIKIFSILCLFLTGCVSVPQKVEYQNTFWIGCMNGMLHYKLYSSYYITRPNKDAPTKSEMNYANYWCKEQYKKIKDL